MVGAGCWDYAGRWVGAEDLLDAPFSERWAREKEIWQNSDE